MGKLIKDFFVWFESLPSSAYMILPPFLVMGFVIALILLLYFLAPPGRQTEGYQHYQDCIQKNIDLEQEVIRSNWENQQFKPYPCEKLLN